MQDEHREFAFLFNYGTYVVYLVILLSTIVNGTVAVFLFDRGRLLLATWALVAIVTLPRSVLALILIVLSGGARQSS